MIRILLPAVALSTGHYHYFAGVGDVNGDSFRDVLLAGYNTDYTYLEYGPLIEGDMDLDYSDVRFRMGTEYDSRDYSLNGAGDVNADGYRDVIIGRYLFYGPIPAGEAHYCDANAMVGESPNELDYGAWISDSAGDINDDGFDDLIVSQNYDVPYPLIFFGPLTGVNSVYDASVVVDGPTFPDSLSGGADINGDDIPDLIFGDRTAGRIGYGAVFVTFGDETW